MRDPGRAKTHSSQESLGRTSVHRNDGAGGTGGFWSRQEQDCFRTVFWIDKAMSEGTSGVKLAEQGPQFLVAALITVGGLIFLQSRDHAIARKHGRPFDHGGRTDTVYSNFRGQRNCELAHQVTERCLTHVVGFATALGHDRVGGTG